MGYFIKETEVEIDVHVVCECGLESDDTIRVGIDEDGDFTGSVTIICALCEFENSLEER